MLSDMRPARITVQRRKGYDDWMAFWCDDQRKHEVAATQAGAIGGLVMNYGRELLAAPAPRVPDVPHEWIAYWGGKDRWAAGPGEKEAVGNAVLQWGADLLRPTDPRSPEVPMPKAVITVEPTLGISHEQALGLAATEFWKNMPEREALLFQLLNPSHLVCMPGQRFPKLLERYLGRPLIPEQMIRPDLLAAELFRRSGEQPRPWVTTFRLLPPTAKRLLGLVVSESKPEADEVMWLVSGPEVKDCPAEVYAWTAKGALRKYRRESRTRWGRWGMPELHVERAGADYLRWRQEEEDRADAMSY